ncbi:MAG: A/G-specific adenine glycosylase [Caldilineaceae bacterium]|nr:A/G-specific adenine glycosylase [Caldilineaceae bacterium]
MPQHPTHPFLTFAQRLIDWHAAQQRELPWRAAPAGQRDAYAVWVSEIMAQQTRIATVVDYFARWMARFSTLESLAAAEQQEVLKLWEGLGYYSRARNLHRAAQMVMEEYGGEIPSSRTELLKLPGIGAYTAGAILSLAYGQAEPILDGNVKRVLARLWDIDRSIDETETTNELWRLAGEIVRAGPQGQAGEVNEGLMELGGLVCTPQNPRCLLCPLAAFCQSAQKGSQSQRPVRTPRKRTPHYQVAAAVIWEDAPGRGRLLIAQRPQKGMLGGLWEFPGGKQETEDADLPATLRREIREELEVEIAVGAPITTVQHAYTHFSITLHAFHARIVSGTPQSIGCDDWHWTTLDEIEKWPFPVTDQKIIAALREPDTQERSPHRKG